MDTPGGDDPVVEDAPQRQAGGGRVMRGGRGGGGSRRSHTANRGDVHAAIVVLLAEEPMHGYQIMQELVGRSKGAWQPSPANGSTNFSPNDLPTKHSSTRGRRDSHPASRGSYSTRR